MYSFYGHSAQEVYLYAAYNVHHSANPQEARHYKLGNTDTKELVHASITIEDPRQRLVFARSINPAFAIAEVIWILAGSNDVNWISFWNRRMADFADGKEYSYGAYGSRLGSMSVDDVCVHPHKTVCKFDQLYNACKALQENPNSRQVVLNIYNAQHDMPGIYGKPRAGDIPCNITAMPLVRDGKLHWLQSMRSNDLIWGTPYNFIQWTTIQEIFAGWLGLELGDFTLAINSLHVYKNHFDDLAAIAGQYGQPYELVPKNTDDLRIKGYENWQPVFEQVYNLATRLTKVSKDWSLDEIYDFVGKVLADSKELPVAYHSWIVVLMAETLRKFGLKGQAEKFIGLAGWYWSYSWKQWANK